MSERVLNAELKKEEEKESENKVVTILNATQEDGFRLVEKY